MDINEIKKGDSLWAYKISASPNYKYFSEFSIPQNSVVTYVDSVYNRIDVTNEHSIEKVHYGTNALFKSKIDAENSFQNQVIKLVSGSLPTKFIKNLLNKYKKAKMDPPKEILELFSTLIQFESKADGLK